ncbi:hypothetical protein B0T20DRAFT_422477 [Sordaria brevicollis]|uniref:SET domain-containing protein n=1 Tax=Sordaria brevicollis TaxID=83679 RepID=A0AAE0U602_SORBR|nr:hypothetical protein B0T20DRAFT_422477 [Sordaria brevicollis]
MKHSWFLLAGAASIALTQEHGQYAVDAIHDHAYNHKACGLEGLGDESSRLAAADILVSGENDVLNHYAGNSTNSHPQELNRPSGHNWTQTTPCFNSIISSDTFCVFTDSSYANGHGISFVTTAERAAYLASLPSFTSPSTIDSSPAKYAISPIPGKGLGLIATTHIPRGSLILSSHPTLMIDYRIFDELLRTDQLSLQAAAISSLPESHQSAFFKLSTHSSRNATDSLSRIALTDSIITTNAFDIPPSPSQSSTPEDPNDSLWYATFASPISPISRLNHACRPNSDYRFDWHNGLVQLITAVRDILPGEEITISYINPLQTRQARQKQLREGWGFDCFCEHCSRSRGRSEESDRRIRLTRKIRRLLKEEGEDEGSEVVKGRTERTKMAELLVSLYEMEGLWGMIYEAYGIAAREYSKAGEAWMAMKWACMAVEFGAMVLGEDDEEVRGMKELVRDPWGHETWKSGKKGGGYEVENEDGKDIDERPEGLELEDGVDEEDDEEGW